LDGERGRRSGRKGEDNGGPFFVVCGISSTGGGGGGEGAGGGAAAGKAQAEGRGCAAAGKAQAEGRGSEALVAEGSGGGRAYAVAVNVRSPGRKFDQKKFSTSFFLGEEKTTHTYSARLKDCIHRDNTKIFRKLKLWIAGYFCLELY
jgi:hypothetical protein